MDKNKIHLNTTSIRRSVSNELDHRLAMAIKHKHKHKHNQIAFKKLDDYTHMKLYRQCVTNLSDSIKNSIRN